DERKEKIDFTQDYYPPTASAYVALADADESVIEGNVAAQTNTIQSGYVAESKGTLVEYAIADETVAAVRNGEADAVFADKDYLKPLVEASNGELKFVGEDVALGGGVGMGIRKSDTEMKEKFDAAITQMKGDGSLNALLEKWFEIKGAY
ncbi:MAG: transporter substrate-binding domain-containing protein, partial [Nitratireductor sp.]|nr:transporter substrate-binding domain-containing protein [Nitratireductor sp.]